MGSEIGVDRDDDIAWGHGHDRSGKTTTVNDHFDWRSEDEVRIFSEVEDVAEAFAVEVRRSAVVQHERAVSSSVLLHLRYQCVHGDRESLRRRCICRHRQHQVPGNGMNILRWTRAYPRALN